MYPLRFLSALAVSCVAVLLSLGSAFGQDVIRPNLAALATDDGTRIHNRSATVLDDGSFKGVHLDAREGDGVLWIPDVDLADGTIDVRIRGRNEPGRSFVGIALHGADDTTYEGVYLRPFNFRAETPQQRAHSMQYIFSPEYSWNVLRESHPGRYEAAIEPAPDPAEWVHLRLVLDGQSLSAYVNDAEQPALVVERISDRDHGSVGLWVGNGSEGDFADLAITHKD